MVATVVTTPGWPLIAVSISLVIFSVVDIGAVGQPQVDKERRIR
jgi:hypothetical protein